MFIIEQEEMVSCYTCNGTEADCNSADTLSMSADVCDTYCWVSHAWQLVFYSLIIVYMQPILVIHDDGQILVMLKMILFKR